MKLQKKLDSLRDFDTFLSVLKDNQIQPKIGTFGGRKFALKTYNGGVSLNNFYQTFKRILSTEKDPAKFDVAEKTLCKLDKIDLKGKKALKSASVWKRVLTRVRSDLGKQFFDRKSEVLSFRLQVHTSKLTRVYEIINSIKQIFNKLTEDIIPRIEKLEHELNLSKFREKSE